MALPNEAALAFSQFDAAIIAATISILLGGILFGAGLGAGLRRVRLLGLEELGQGILSAAMVGALISFSTLLDATASSLVPASSLPSCPGVQSPSSAPFSFYACHLQFLSSSFASLSSQLARSADIAGFAGTLTISAGVITSQPFYSLQAASQSLSAASARSAEISALSYAEMSLADSVRSAALAVFLPAGLLLRSFFATRKLGAAAMALSISAFMAYPLLFLYTFQASKSGAAAGQALSASESFNSRFAALPLLELGETSSVLGAVRSMSDGDFSSRAQPMLSLAHSAHSLALADIIFYPLISLAVSAIFALELYRILSAPLFLPYFEQL